MGNLYLLQGKFSLYWQQYWTINLQNYIHQNPVEEGLVFKAEDYMYSSAYDYAGGNGMLDILVID